MMIVMVWLRSWIRFCSRLNLILFRVRFDSILQPTRTIAMNQHFSFKSNDTIVFSNGKYKNKHRIEHLYRLFPFHSNRIYSNTTNGHYFTSSASSKWINLIRKKIFEDIFTIVSNNMGFG